MLPVALILAKEFMLPPITLPVIDATVALTLPPTTLPVVLTAPEPALTLPPSMLPVVLMADVEFNALITLPLRLKLVALTLAALTFPTALTLPLVVFPVTMAVGARRLPPVMLAVVVMLAVDNSDDTTLPLKLKPVAFRLPLVTLPVAVILVAPTVVAVIVVIVAPTADTLATALMLPPLTLPTDENVCSTTTLLAVMVPLPPYVLPTLKLFNMPTFRKLLNNTLELNVFPYIKAALVFTEMPVRKNPLPVK
jgi:hypothetical protein